MILISGSLNDTTGREFLWMVPKRVPLSNPQTRGIDASMRMEGKLQFSQWRFETRTRGSNVSYGQ